jgi:arylsulfatase A-like enzyme
VVGRKFLRFVAASALLSLPSVGSPHRAEAQRQQPNILIIVTDDQRASGTMMRSVMPFTRKVFRRGGTRFPSAYATTPFCCPSRATLFTGRYAHNHRVKTNFDAEQLDQESTIQYHLKRAGYRTAIFGKYLNNWDITLPPPYFHRWATFGSGLQFSNGYYDVRFNVQGTVRTISQYSTEFIASRAVRFIRAAEAEDSRPWFLYVAPFAPHGPAVPKPGYGDAPVPRFRKNPAMLEEDRSDKPPYVQRSSADFDKIRRFRRRQLRTLMSVDDLVERVFRQLWEAAEGRRTLAFFVSDNGFLWGEHGRFGKNVPYTESIRIPMFARWPGRFGAGAVDRRLTGNVDIVPTILDAAGVDPLTTLDGRSLLQAWERDRMLTEHWWSGPPPWASLVNPLYQYTEYYEADEQTVRFREYYDMAADPWQLTNLLGDPDPDNDPAPERLDELSAQLAADRSCSGPDCP